MLEYACDFYEFDGGPQSLQGIPELGALLNKYAAGGWALVDAKPVAAGFVVIFSRPAKVEVAPVAG